MSEKEYMNKWLDAFTKDVDPKKIKKYVTAKYNYLWHIFSYELVECLEGDEARKAFDKMEYDRAIRFYDGYSASISDVAPVGKLTARDLDEDTRSDVYVAAEDFSWTYVRTHEVLCGPYLCIKKK